MFDDADGIKKLAMENKNLASRISEWLDDFAKKVLSLANDLYATYEEENFLKWGEEAKKLRDLWWDAMKVASGRNKALLAAEVDFSELDDGRGVRYQRDTSDPYAEYDKPRTVEDINDLREIIKAHNGERVSINDFTSEDIQRAQKWAYKSWKSLGIKSPFFRASFGEWRAYDTTDVHTVNIEKDTRGEKVNRDTGWLISRSAKVSGEKHNSVSSISGRYYLKFIDGIIENSVLLDSAVSDNKNENSVFFHYLYGVVKENGHNTVIKLAVEEQQIPVKGDIKRAYKLIDITKHQPSGVGSANNLTSSQAADAIKTISDLYNFVKTYDKDFHAGKPVNPVLLDENGEPKEFYHQTEDDFTVFDIGREGAGTRDNETPFGIFLKSTDRDIGLKGKKQISAISKRQKAGFHFFSMKICAE